MSRTEAATHRDPDLSSQAPGGEATQRLVDTDDGFVILDVLIGILVLAILLLTVIMSVGPYRQRSWQASAVSDARQLGQRIEATLSDYATLVAAGLPASEDTLTDSQLDTLGVNLTRGIAVARYTPLNSTRFQVCLVHYSGATVDAFALYDSTRGRVTTSGRGAGPAACAPASAPPPTPTPTGSPSPTTGPEPPAPSVPGPSDPPASAIAAPANVQVAAVPGETKATVSWDAVSGAAGYAVYLDGAATPAWTGTGLTADLTGLSTGPHSVTVTARAGSDESVKSDAATFTIYGDNDFVRFAHPVTIGGPAQTWTSRDYTNQGATFESGETNDLGSQRGMWWTYVAPASGSVRVSVVVASDGTGPFPYPGIHVWKTTGTDIATVQAAPRLVAGYRSNTEVFPAVKGQTYKIRVGNTYGEVSKYAIKVETGPANDNSEEAITVPALAANAAWTSPDQNNGLAGLQPGENGGENGSQRGMWWTYTATTGGATRVSAIAASDGSGPFPNGGIHVWDTTSTDIATIQASPRLVAGYRSNAETFVAVKGRTYQIRVGNTYGEVSNFRVRIETGPGNDNVADAVAIGSLTSGQSHTSADFSNAIAAREPGEDTGLGSERSLWWTFTATDSGNLRVSVIAATDGTTLPNPGIYAWDSTATTAAQVQTGTRYGDWGTTSVTFAVTAGKTYKIRVGNTYGYIGKFRVKVDRL